MATAFLEPASAQDDAAGLEKSWEAWVMRLTWAVVLLGIAWRVGRYLAQFPLWGDEAHVAVNFQDRDFWGMTGKLDYGQVAPILFLWMEWLAYQVLGPSELSLRLGPMLAGIAGLLLFWRFCRLTLPGLAASLAVCLLAVSYYPVRHGAEIKPYSLDLLMAMALLLPAVHLVREPGRMRWAVLLALVTPVAVASSYPSVFVAGALSLYLLPTAWRASWQGRGWYVFFNLAMVATFLAHLFLVGREQLQGPEGAADSYLHDYWKDWFPPASLAELPLWLLRAHTGNMMAYPVGGPHFGSGFTLFLCLAGVWGLWTLRRLDLLGLCLLPFALSLAAAFVRRYPYGGSARLAQHLAPAICILMAVGVTYLLTWVPRASWRRGWVLTSFLCLVLIGVGGLVETWLKPYKTVGDVRIREMARSLAGEVRPGDAIVVFSPHHMARPSMVWYLQLLGPTIVWDGKANWDAVDSGQRLWGVHLRWNDKNKPAAEKLVAPSHAAWDLAEHQEHFFAADSKDVPLQYCEVFFWKRE